MTDQFYDVLILGDYYCDLIFTGMREPPRLSADLHSAAFDIVPGAAYRTALAFSRLNMRAGWITDFGDDFFSQFVLDMARREGIDPSLFRLHPFPVRRISVAFSFAHDRGFISYVDQFEPESPLALIAKHRPRVVLLTSLSYGPDHEALVTAAHAAGALVFMDCQAHDVTLADEAVRAALARVDMFAPNQHEALHLAGAVTVDEALDALSAIVPRVVIKCGGAGARAKWAGRTVHAPGIAVDVVDTTGAGDCFNAGFLYGLLRDQPLEHCLRFGNICGGLATTAHTNDPLPTEAALLEYMARYDA